jgi:hypothetical protein
MFPISSEQTLRFIDIANYWSGEIKPRVPPRVLRDALSKAWWCGKLVAANGPSRVHLLRALHSKCADEIAFVIPGTPELPCSRPLDDGGVEVFRLVRVPLPNAQSDTWTEANCTDAFSAIAEAWDEELFWLPAYEIPFIVLTRSEFIQWAEKYGYGCPTFWTKKAADKAVRSKLGRKSRQAARIYSALEELFLDNGGLQDGKPGWSIQADAEKAVRKKLGEELGDDAPGESTVRPHVREFITNLDTWWANTIGPIETDRGQ